MNAQPRVLARITARWFFSLSPAHRQELRGWLRANGIDACTILVRRDVEILALDAPVIVREELVLDEHGKVRWVETPYGRDVLGGEVHSLLRVPLPRHLAEPG